MCSILLLPLVSRCIETIDVCIWCMFAFKSVVVTVWGSVVIPHTCLEPLGQESFISNHFFCTSSALVRLFH